MRVLPSLIVVFLAGSVQAQPQEAANGRARAHFQEGLSYVEQGDLDSALREFEAAYAAQPHPSVLYNIAQAHLGLGQPLQAIEAFERYLREGGAQVPAERRRDVERSLAAGRSRLGQVRLTVVAPERTRAWLDGKEIRPEQWVKPISVVAGEHHLVYSVDAAGPTALTLQVSRGGSSEVRLEAITPPPTPPLQLSVRCPVPGVTVEVGGNGKLTTPLSQPILVPASSTRVRFTRAGYRSVERALPPGPLAFKSVDCALEREPLLPPVLRAALLVRASPRDAETLVDGEPYFGGELPAGLHDLTTRRDGFVSMTKTVDVLAGQTLEYTVALQRTESSRGRIAAARSSRHWLGVGLSGLGVALLASAGGLFLWNNQRYRDWESHQGASTFAHNMSSVVSLQRVDDLCIGLTILGAGASASGVWLFATPPKDTNP